MLDLENLLRACEGTNVKVYTHGEMLPAFMYPKLREHPNLAGHYGDAWQKRRQRVRSFQRSGGGHYQLRPHPRESYAGRVFTTRVTAVPGGTRIVDDDFSAVGGLRLACAPLADAPRGHQR